MKLYGFAPSPNTWQVRALAAHLHMLLEFVALEFAKGDNRTPEFLAINPTGRTPALVDGDFRLWETLAIMQYVAGRKPNTLWPDDSRLRADIMRWQSWNLAHWNRDAFAPVLTERLVKKVFDLGPPDEAAIAKGTEAFDKEAKMLDTHLAGRRYLASDNLTIADFAVAAPLFYVKQAELPLNRYANIGGWFARISALPCWQQTAPQMPAAA
jgi:glutathione S-transferase